MPPLPPPLYEVYSRQLLVVQRGYPLWDAEPENHRYEVEIGTVGRLDSGKLWLLFNAMKPANDPYQKHGVPRNFEPFNPPKSMVQGPWEIQNNLFSSKTVKHGNITADLNAASPDGMVTAGGGLKFTSSENTGAFLLHTPPAVCMKLVSKRAIVRYMRDNLDHWLEFANDEHGMMLNADQFYFVYGTVKTSKWACAAFQGNVKSIEGSLQAQVVNSGLNMSISLSTEDATRLEYNFGPTVSDGDESPLQLTAGSQEGGSPRPPPRRDQCIFVNYYKAKKRLLWKPKIIQAAAEPQNLPPGDQDDSDDGVTESVSSGSDSDVEGEAPDRKVSTDQPCFQGSAPYERLSAAIRSCRLPPRLYLGGE
ncbi:hypothetical protein C8Q73DRAFT_658067 [Cubamyces lactineus]|nr:hypothetical protein C8Q73DRAFT_658067 [Cubamyces lactineus]